MSYYWKPKKGRLKVKVKDACILEFKANQPVRAYCTAVQIDMYDRVFYELELFITDDWSEKGLANAEKTYLGFVSGAYVFPLQQYLATHKSFAQRGGF